MLPTLARSTTSHGGPLPKSRDCVATPRPPIGHSYEPVDGSDSVCGRPWAAVLDAAASSLAIGKACERATNAQTLLKQAEKAYEQATDEALRATDELRDAQDRLNELESDW